MLINTKLKYCIISFWQIHDISNWMCGHYSLSIVYWHYCMTFGWSICCISIACLLHGLYGWAVTHRSQGKLALVMIELEGLDYNPSLNGEIIRPIPHCPTWCNSHAQLSCFFLFSFPRRRPVSFLFGLLCRYLESCSQRGECSTSDCSFCFHPSCPSHRSLLQQPASHASRV